MIELIHFVGQLASVGLQLEGCSTLLLNFVLDFYETVTDAPAHAGIFHTRNCTLHVTMYLSSICFLPGVDCCRRVTRF